MKNKQNEENEFVSPLEDFVFSQIFGDQQNLGSTKAFLKTLLDIPADDYDQLKVEDPTLKRFFKKDKKSVVDLRLTTKSGKIIHIELQVEKDENMRSRIMQYATRLVSDQLKKGDKYGEIHQVVSICICDHVLLDEEDYYANDYELRNRKGHSFTDLLKVVILELPKLPEKEDEAVWPWLRFFKCKKQEEFEMLARKHPELKEAVSCVRKMSLGEQWRAVMSWRWNQKMALRGQKEYIRLELERARTKAKAEGHAEGHAEEKLEIARNLKKMGLPVSQIVEVTGLTPEEIQKL
jgi:predicted transposase/invertase (TIGR01784 family)